MINLNVLRKTTADLNNAIKQFQVIRVSIKLRRIEMEHHIAQMEHRLKG